MANEYLEELQKLDTPWFYRIAWIGGALLFVLAGYLWWNYASVNPERVFWGTVSNNLVISGVTKETVTNEANGSLNQVQQISLGAQNAATSITTVEQKAVDASSTKVVTETVATPQADFSRYISIETSQKTTTSQAFDFGAALNIWSKQDLAQEGNGAFTEALYGLLPLAFIQGNERHAIVSDMQKNKVYDVQYDSLKKRRENGRLIYDYTVAIDAEQYVKVLKQVDAAMGINQLESVDPSQYSGGAPIEVQISIDAHAQQVVSITYPDGARVEKYSAYGVSRPYTLPENAITREELQTKLNDILNK